VVSDIVVPSAARGQSAANEGARTGLVSSFAPQTANHAHAVLSGGSDTLMHPHEYGTDSSRPAN
jgi:hypothetical protein